LLNIKYQTPNLVSASQGTPTNTYFYAAPRSRDCKKGKKEGVLCFLNHFAAYDSVPREKL
jgi:hypothetical protein